MNFIVETAEVVQNFPYLPFAIIAKPLGLTFLPWVRKRTETARSPELDPGSVLLLL